MNDKMNDKWIQVMNEMAAERGQADQDDMNWWRDQSTTLDENVRIQVYDWDADATDMEIWTRREAIMRGKIRPTAEEVKLLEAEGVTLPTGTQIADAPTGAPADATSDMTLAEAVQRYGNNVAGTVSGMRIIRVVSVTPTLITAIVSTRSGGEREWRFVPSAKVTVEERG